MPHDPLDDMMKNPAFAAGFREGERRILEVMRAKVSRGEAAIKETAALPHIVTDAQQADSDLPYGSWKITVDGGPSGTNPNGCEIVFTGLPARFLAEAYAAWKNSSNTYAAKPENLLDGE